MSNTFLENTTLGFLRSIRVWFLQKHFIPVRKISTKNPKTLDNRLGSMDDEHSTYTSKFVEDLVNKSHIFNMDGALLTT